MRKELLIQKHARVWVADKNLVLRKHVMKRNFRSSHSHGVDHIINSETGREISRSFRLTEPICISISQNTREMGELPLMKFATIKQLQAYGYMTIETGNSKWPWMVIPKAGIASLRMSD